MDFLDFLKEGGYGSVKRVVFDGKFFKRQGEDINGINDYFELDGERITEKGSGYTGYTLSKHSTAFGGPLTYSIYKGNITDYYIEIENGMVTIKKGGGAVGNNDQSRADVDNSASNSPGIIRLIFKLVLGYLIACFPPMIFNKFLKNAKLESKVGNAFYLFAIFLGFIFFGGQMILMSTMNSFGVFGFLTGAGKTGVFGIYIVYTVCHTLNLLTFFLAKKISKIFKSKRAITIAFVIYSVIFVVLILIFALLYILSIKSI